MADSTRSGPFVGLSVLDLSWGAAGPMTAMLLADSGADVLRVESPHGDPVRDDVAYRVWNRGKRSAVLDLRDPAQHEAFLALADRADVLVESFEPGVTRRLGIDPATLRARNPRLVYCSITGYGPDGPDAHRPGLDSLVAARTGLQWEARGVVGTPLNKIRGAAPPNEDVEIPDLPANRFDQEGPVFLRSTWPSLGAAYNAIAGVSAALRARELTGRGDLVETSLVQGAMAANAPNWQWIENLAAPGVWMWVTDRRSPEGLFECSDGRWVHFWTIRPTLVLDAAEGDELVLDGPRDDMRTGVRIGMDADEVPILYMYYGLLQAAFKKFPAERWVAFGAARNIGIALVRSPEEAFSDEALLRQGCVVELADPEVGPIRHAGVLLEFSATPGAVQGPAAPRGQHTADVLAAAPADSADVVAANSADVVPAGDGAKAPPALRRGPLDGVRVLDLGLGVAGPWGGKVLADLGAEVIKVHALHDGYWTRTHMGLATNWGKRSIALNLKDPAGRAVLEKLIASADVLAHNMRPGAAERLGIGFAELGARYPKLIYCHTRGFEDGPRSRQPGTDQTANALAGTEYEDGACRLGGAPLWSRVNMGDTGNGYLWATAVIQALYHRERTGLGQKVSTAIINATLLATSYAYSRADGATVDRPRIDARQQGLSASHGLYRLAGGDWLSIAVLAEASWPDLCDALGAPELVDDPRFASPADRAAHDADLRAALQPLFARRTAQEILPDFEKRDLPCELSVDTFGAALFTDPALRRLGDVVTAQVDGVGKLEQTGVLVRLTENPGVVAGPPCLAGEHSRDILAELGYATGEIDALVAARSVLAG
ncbi:CaiB/BaiF CoA transferase family protein [Pseudofrankia inefficax]|uniref:L-carnitine dehydratase/bile acid-inducible protein F n=1 Tax=Pseudofrankia inefficax (strain DSM 45817 / CECT 9037 / DDB 130130 / EuI1c) TaxID=298654 RepID=E3JC89_PSEI1|nr:CoA transferase [Pseudofrankia inefficax]ADP83545.1 L-carnitine dehydratase/bile acid-inducible protein F [Pseudofrankia inefficax]